MQNITSANAFKKHRRIQKDVKDSITIFICEQIYRNTKLEN